MNRLQQRLLNEHKRKWSGNNGGASSHDLSLAARRSPAAMAAAAAAAVAGSGAPPESFHPSNSSFPINCLLGVLEVT